MQPLPRNLPMLARLRCMCCGVATWVLCLLVLLAATLPRSAQAGEPLVLAQDRPQVDAWEAITLKLSLIHI